MSDFGSAEPLPESAIKAMLRRLMDNIRLPTTAKGWLQLVVIVLAIAVAFASGPGAGFSAVMGSAPFFMG